MTRTEQLKASTFTTSVDIVLVIRAAWPFNVAYGYSAVQERICDLHSHQPNLASRDTHTPGSAHTHYHASDSLSVCLHMSSRWSPVKLQAAAWATRGVTALFSAWSVPSRLSHSTIAVLDGIVTLESHILTRLSCGSILAATQLLRGLN